MATELKKTVSALMVDSLADYKAKLPGGRDDHDAKYFMMTPEKATSEIGYNHCNNCMEAIVVARLEGVQVLVRQTGWELHAVAVICCQDSMPLYDEKEAKQ
jgi:hypothetical protein